MNTKGAQHVAALSMQIAARCSCGITDLQRLTEIRKSADELLDAINDSLFTDDTSDAFEQSKRFKIKIIVTVRL